MPPLDVPRCPPPADEHVHSEFSWDTGPDASMWRACARAAELGLPAISFTEHVDFTSWAPGDVPLVEDRRPRASGWYAPVDVAGYAAAVERCRAGFPGLRVRTGIEAGEPHRFAGSVARVLGSGEFERVLGSLHSVVRDDELVGVGRVLRRGEDPTELVREYFAELLAMVKSSTVFEVLAHCDFPRRYWPRHRGRYEEATFEAEYRAVFAALARSGRVLEVNTTSPLASVELLGWWRECGGERISFGSDAHVPWRVGQQFSDAVAVAEAAGFRPGQDPGDFFHR